MKTRCAVGSTFRTCLITVWMVPATALMLSPCDASAKTCTWTGGYWSGYWSASQNWDTDAPDPGDDLVFPPGAAQLVNTNNMGNPTFRSITISGNGYLLRGSTGGATIGLTHGIEANTSGSANTVELNIDLHASQTFECNSSTAELVVSGDIDLGSHTLTTRGAGQVRLRGEISGAGNLTKTGSGTHWLEGPSGNTLTGTIRVNNATLMLAKTEIPGIRSGELVIGDGYGSTNTAIVRAFGNDQIGTLPITIHSDGWLDVGTYVDTVSAITFNGGCAGSTTGELRLGGNVTVLVASEEARLVGNVSLGRGTRTFDVADRLGFDLRVSAVLSGGGLAKTGPGAMVLEGANTYTGETTVEEGAIYVDHNDAFGDISGGTTVSGSGLIQLSRYVAVGLEPLTLARTSSGKAIYATADASWAGNVVLSTDAELGAGDLLELSGAISGPGGITFDGAAYFVLSGSADNVYTGPTVAERGVLQLDKGYSRWAIGHGSLTVGAEGSGPSATVQALGPNQLGSIPITVNYRSLLDLNNFNDTVGDSLTLNNGGRIETGTGTLSLLANSTITAAFDFSTDASVIAGRLHVGTGSCSIHLSDGPFHLSAETSGAADLYVTGNNALWLTSSNSFAGTLTLQDTTSVVVDHDEALGSTSGGTVVEDMAHLAFGGSGDVHVGGEPLTLNGVHSPRALWIPSGSHSWAGPVTLSQDSVVDFASGGAHALDLAGPVSGPGALIKRGGGTLIFSGADPNTYTGDTQVEAGVLVLDKAVPDVAIAGALFVGDGMGGTDADVTRLETDSQIPITTRITVSDSGLFDMNGVTDHVGSLAGSGHVTLGAGTLGTGLDDSSSTFSGLIEGSGSLEKAGRGTFELSGNNTYAGGTVVHEGTLLINGSQPGSDVTVSAPGTLGGSGTVGDLQSSGTVAPGGSAGKLSCRKAALYAHSTLAVELDGYTPLEYDQLDVGRAISIDRAGLSLKWGYVPAVGDEFTIIESHELDPVVGMFDELPEGASVTADNVVLEITYRGGDGNDVVLTATEVEPIEELRFDAVARSGGDALLQWEGGVPLYQVNKKVTLGSNTLWQPVGPPTRDFQIGVPMDTDEGYYQVEDGH